MKENKFLDAYLTGMSERDIDGEAETDDVEIEGIDVSVDRRKVLSAATAAAGGSAGLSSLATAEGDDVELTAAEVERALAEADIVPADAPVGTSADDVDLSASDIPRDADVFVGQHKNADVPGADAYEVQSYEEWLRQDVPTGYEDVVRTQYSDLFYFQKDVGSVTIEGYTFDVGIGLGLTISGGGFASLDASLSVDIYINGASFAITEFTVGYGKDGLCVSVPIRYGPIPGLQVDVCLNLEITSEGDDICFDASGSIGPCVDPCPIITCSYCKTLSSPPVSQCFEKPF